MFDVIKKLTIYNESSEGKLIFILVLLTAVFNSFKLLMKKNLVIYWKFEVYIKLCYHIVRTVEIYRK